MRDILRRKKNRFNKICSACELALAYEINKDGLGILEDIFVEREYADYFPFYERATIVDIGAHYGYFSIFAAKNTDPASTIYSFEPSKKNFEILQKNLESCEISNVNPFQVAVGDKKGKGELYEGESANNSMITNYPLLKGEKNTSTVEVLDLNTLIRANNIDNIDFLKLDCEGAEYPILLNTPFEVLDKIKVLSMEFHDLKKPAYTANKLIEKLEANQFDIVKYTYGKTSMNLNYGRLIARNRASGKVL